MNFLDGIINWDKQALLTINSYHEPWLDRFMWLVSDTTTWIPLMIIFLYLLFKNKGIKGFVILLMIGLLILFTDQVASAVIKPSVERLRPTHDPEIGDWINVVNGYRGGRYGFISSHAANVFAFAGFSLLLIRRASYSVVILLWAGLVSFSRLYLGVHYPLDVMAGGLFGFLSALGLFVLYKHFFELRNQPGRNLNKRMNKTLTSGGYLKSDVALLNVSMFLLLLSVGITAISLTW